MYLLAVHKCPFVIGPARRSVSEGCWLLLRQTLHLHMIKIDADVAFLAALDVLNYHPFQVHL